MCDIRARDARKNVNHFDIYTTRARFAGVSDFIIGNLPHAVHRYRYEYRSNFLRIERTASAAPASRKADEHQRCKTPKAEQVSHAGKFNDY